MRRETEGALALLKAHFRVRGFCKLAAVSGRQIFAVQRAKFLFRNLTVSTGARNPRFCAAYAIGQVLLRAS